MWCNNSTFVWTKCAALDGWVNNLAQEQDVFCLALNDHCHKWTVELQDRDVAERHKRDADACSSCSGSSSLIHIKGSLVYNLEDDDETRGIQNIGRESFVQWHIQPLPQRLPVFAPQQCRSNLHDHQTCLSFPSQSTQHLVSRRS